MLVNNNASMMYAVEGGGVLAPCVVVSQEMVDRLNGKDPIKSQLLLKGGDFATIYTPDESEITERLAEYEEGILYADVDLSMIIFAKSVADPIGHYSRPDVTQLLLNSKKRLPVVETAIDEEIDIIWSIYLEIK